LTTDLQAKWIAHELFRRHAADTVEKLAAVLADTHLGRADTVALS
jgi:hypothetical protein